MSKGIDDSSSETFQREGTLESGETLASQKPAAAAATGSDTQGESGTLESSPSHLSALLAPLPQSQTQSTPLLTFEERYALAHELARGAMGRVITGSDRIIGREVAVKEMLGPVSQHAIARFVRESLMTARLQHPSIIPVYDVGRRATGEPYLVMRLVHGKPLSELIDGAISLNDRLRLLPSVLGAIDALAYAHQRQVIHRDLKPANILVGEFGETVVIDWGLAKDLREVEDQPEVVSGFDGGDGGALTLSGSILGTPTHMAPEQAQGRPADKRSDVYALGAVLYHLLSGEAPYDGETAREVVKKVATREPVALEKRAPDLPTDLITIVRTAMSRDPAMRFQTAGELAEELRRFQSGQLVSKHRYSFGELIGRWAKKNRVVLTVAAIALVILGTVGVVSVRRIVDERDRANREAKTAKRITDFVTEMFTETNPDNARNHDITALEVLNRAKGQIDKEELSKDPAVQAKVMHVMGDLYVNLGANSEAETLFRRALRSKILLYGNDAEETMSTRNELAVTLYQEAKFPEAEKMMRELIADRVRIDGNDDKRTLGAKGNLGNLLDDTGHYDEALKLSEEGLAQRTRLFGPDDPTTMMAAGNLISAYVHEDRVDLAVVQARKVLENDTRVWGADNTETLNVADSLANLLVVDGKLKEAEEVILKTLPLEKRVFGPEHPTTLDSLAALANVYLQEKKTDEGEKLLRETMETAVRVEGPDVPNVLAMHGLLAALLLEKGQTKEARRMYEELIERKTRVFGAENPQTLITVIDLAKVAFEEKRYAEAEALQRRAVEGRKVALGDDSSDAAAAREDLAATRLARGDRQEALSLLEESVAKGMLPAQLKGLEADARFQALSGDPRFTALAAQAKVRAGQIDAAHQADVARSAAAH